MLLRSFQPGFDVVKIPKTLDRGFFQIIPSPTSRHYSFTQGLSFWRERKKDLCKSFYKMEIVKANFPTQQPA